LPLEPLTDVPPFIRLGAEFLHANRARIELNTDPFGGQLIVP
jgi:hypothetical protein